MQHQPASQQNAKHCGGRTRRRMGGPHPPKPAAARPATAAVGAVAVQLRQQHPRGRGFRPGDNRAVPQPTHPRQPALWSVVRPASGGHLLLQVHRWPQQQLVLQHDAPQPARCGHRRGAPRCHYRGRHQEGQAGAGRVLKDHPHLGLRDQPSRRGVAAASSPARWRRGSDAKRGGLGHGAAPAAVDLGRRARQHRGPAGRLRG
mmetsp:Transcript_3884/g.9714  ORF Transcript_3884/g.9714 Transcript_3884/m.9714 type:complete len:203 (+) Transcript_3884:58-666(+)